MMLQSSLKKRYADRFDIALSDFILGFQEQEIKNLNDLYSFAEYMHGFYPNIPYFEVANLIITNINKDNNVEEQYGNILQSQNFGLKSIRCGHFLEIIGYSDINKKMVYVKKQ